MSFVDDMEELGADIKQKREAEKAAKEQAEELKEQVAKDQEQHEENKRQGML